MNIIEAARRSLQDSSSSSSSKRPDSPSSSSQDWCPVLPAARDVLPAVLVHTQGVSKAVGWLQLQQQGPEDTSLKQQQGRGKKKAASGGASLAPAAERNKLYHLSIQAVNNFLAAALAVSKAAKEAGNQSRAVAASKEALQAANEVLLFPLAAAQLAASGAKAPMSSSSSRSSSLLPDVTSYSLLIALHGAAGEFQSVSDLVMAAVRGNLPLGKQQQQHEVWSPGAVEVVLSAAAGVWLAAGAADVAVSLLDGLLVTGGAHITQPTLAATLLEAADKGQEQVWQGASSKPLDISNERTPDICIWQGSVSGVLNAVNFCPF
jgi:hypothetical protein